MRLVEIRLLDGPNVYRLEPVVKIEVGIGRRRTWFGQRMPAAHARVRLGAPVASRAAPQAVVTLARWIRRLHRLSGAARWLTREPGPEGGSRRALPVTIHGTSEPGHWVVAFPWREEERARTIAEGAWHLAHRGADPARTRARGRRSAATRALTRVVVDVRAARGSPPAWIRDEDRRVPIVSITGTNGKSTTTRMVTHILRVAGRRVGTTTSDGVLVDERLVEPGDWTGPGGASRVLARADVDVAVLETARGGIVLRGVGYESNEASVITNVSSDHLDLHGLHTLPELAEVKAVVARITKRDGLVVLNGDDPLVAAVAGRVTAPVCLFSLRPENARVRRHVAAGGRAMVLLDEWIVELARNERAPILRAAEAPATLLGLARHNVANALAAAAAARALGVERDDVARGLRDFRPSAEHAPGRVNLYRVRDRVVIVDFAHNEAGVNVVLDVAEGIAGPRGGRRRPLFAIIGTAGDRPDDTLRGIGRIAAARADAVAIKETMRYLRGRPRESVVGEILAGMVDGGVRRNQVAVYESETAALRTVLGARADDAAGPGVRGRATPTPATRRRGTGAHAPVGERAVIVLLVHEDREGVEALLGELGGQPLDPARDLPALVGERTARARPR